jgi:hypothetical protein
VSSVPMQAEPIADFYRGKTLRMLVGYGAGGATISTVGLSPSFLPRHVPGNPRIAGSMPGRVK